MNSEHHPLNQQTNASLPPIFLDGDHLSIEEVVAVARGKAPPPIAKMAIRRVEASRAWIARISSSTTAQEHLVIYGVNTGFGSLASQKVDPAYSAQLSRNLVVTHAVGVGPAFEEDVVRATLLIRASTLAKGLSGVRVKTIQTLLDMINAGVIPYIPSKGSVGASGDLAPLAHMTLVMTKPPAPAKDTDIESGKAFYQGKLLPGKQAMAAAGIERLVLEAKEGVALTNGTALSAALGVLALYRAENIARHAELGLAMSTEALTGFRTAFRPDIHQARNHKGQQRVARNVLRLLTGSNLLLDGKEWPAQDPYSIRCAPQVIGAVRDTLGFVRSTLEDEITAATDNPLIFLSLEDENKALSGGNFHGEPLAFAMDYLKIATAELANIAERRVFKLLDVNQNRGLPAMLIPGMAGLESGLMLTQYTAASLVSDNKTLAHPDSVDSIPTCANQEDHVSMSTNAARHATEVIWNTERVVEIELLVAAQALSLRLAGLDSLASKAQRGGVMPQLGKGTQAALRQIRASLFEAGLPNISLQENTPLITGDTVFTPHLEVVHQLVHSEQLLVSVQEALAETLE